MKIKIGSQVCVVRERQRVKGKVAFDTFDEDTGAYQSTHRVPFHWFDSRPTGLIITDGNVFEWVDRESETV